MTEDIQMPNGDLLMTIEEIRDEFNFRVIQVKRSFVWEPDALANKFLDELEVRKEKMNRI